MTTCSTALVRILTVSALTAFAGANIAQPVYPNKPIRFIIPFPPAGISDIVARLIGQKLTESWGQQVIVDNRPGGNSIIGTEALVKSPPDGYTIMLAGTAHLTNPSLLHTPYDAVKDFAAVATVVSTEWLLVLNPSVPANNLQEFIALAKSKPGQLNYASVGSGSAARLATELFNIMAQVKTQYVPYKGGGQALTDLIGGRVQLFFSPPSIAIAHVKGARLRAIAVSGGVRLSALPQVPTFTEAGLAGFDVKTWYGILAPAGTPKAIIDKLSAETAKILALPEFKDKVDSQGMAPFISTPDEVAALIKADMVKFARVIKTANIKFEE